MTPTLIACRCHVRGHDDAVTDQATIVLLAPHSSLLSLETTQSTSHVATGETLDMPAYHRVHHRIPYLNTRITSSFLRAESISETNGRARLRGL